MTTWLHEERFAGVMQVLQSAKVQSVIDLGCGSGDFLLPLARQDWISRVVGVEQAAGPLMRLRAEVARLAEPVRTKVKIVEGSVLDPAVRAGLRFDAVVMIEVIEHLEPQHLSLLEAAIFAPPAPGLVLITTPNADFNHLLGVPPNRFRHPGHRFEWGRARFADWARGVADRAGCGVSHEDLGGRHPDIGGASQMAVFVRSIG